MSESVSVDPKLLEILVCPLTKGPLIYDAKKQELFSKQAALAYPILWPDGARIWRGPVVKIPAYNPKRHSIAIDTGAIDRFAAKGWVDLRPKHAAWWIAMFERMHVSTRAQGSKRS